MNDNTLLKLIKLMKQDEIDGAYRNTIGGAEVAIAPPYYRTNNNRSRRAEIMLTACTEDELNDFRTILAIGRYARFTDDKSRAKYAPKKFNDLAAWRSYLSVDKLEHGESLKEIKKMTAGQIRENINAYLYIKPMSNIKRNFLNIIKNRH